MMVWDLIDKHPLPPETWTMIFSKPPIFLDKKAPAIRKTPRVTIEGKWSHIRQFVEALRRDGWRETKAASGEPTGFQFTTVEFER